MAGAPRWRSGSRFEIPAREVPGIVVPAGELGHELVLYAGDAGTGDDRDDDPVVHRQLVALDQERRALQRIELDFGRLVGVLVFLVLPARHVAALPLVGFGRELR